MPALLARRSTSEATIRVFDDLRVHSCAGPSGSFTTVARDGRRLVLVYFRGAGVLHHRDGAALVPAGSLCFLPGDAPIRFSDVEDGGVVCVELPARVFAQAQERVDAATSRTITAATGAPAFLRSFLDTLDQQLPDYRPENPGWVQSCVCDIAERVLSECVASRPTERQRVLQAARSYILSHLTDAELAPPRVAREAAVSLRQLNRLFADEGDSLGGWIRHQRLERCREDLGDPAKADRTISQIGAVWGFLDAAHFSRAFKDAFGCSPRAYRNRRLAASSQCPARPDVDVSAGHLDGVHRVA